MKVELNAENTDGLLTAEKIVGVEPGRLLNDWILNGLLSGPGRLDYLWALVDATVFETQEEADRAASALREAAREHGRDIRAPEMTVQAH